MAEVKTEKEKNQSGTKEKQIKPQESAFVRMRDGIGRYFRETRGELRRVTWPTREESQRLTGVVIAVSIVFALFLGSLDFVFSRLVGALISLLS